MQEQRALENLTKSDHILIKQAVKGSGVVVMERTRYVAKTMRQLSDVEDYIQLNTDPVAEMVEKVNITVKKAHVDGFISDSTYTFFRWFSI